MNAFYKEALEFAKELKGVSPNAFAVLSAFIPAAAAILGVRWNIQANRKNEYKKFQYDTLKERRLAYAQVIPLLNNLFDWPLEQVPKKLARLKQANVIASLTGSAETIEEIDKLILMLDEYYRHASFAKMIDSINRYAPEIRLKPDIVQQKVVCQTSITADCQFYTPRGWFFWQSIKKLLVSIRRDVEEEAREKIKADLMNEEGLKRWAEQSRRKPSSSQSESTPEV